MEYIVGALVLAFVGRFFYVAGRAGRSAEIASSGAREIYEICKKKGMSPEDIQSVEYDTNAMRWAKGRFRELNGQNHKDGRPKNELMAESVYGAWLRRQRAHMVFPVIKWGLQHKMQEFDHLEDSSLDQDPFLLSDRDIDSIYWLESISGLSSSEVNQFLPVRSIPSEVFLLPNLRHFSIGGGMVRAIRGRIDGLPETIAQARNLRVLILYGCGLKEIPGFVFTPWIEEINLNNNKISVVPDAIGAARSLKALRLGGNDLEYISQALCSLENLKVLHAYGNPRLRLPDAIPNLGAMDELMIPDDLPSLTPAQRDWICASNRTSH